MSLAHKINIATGFHNIMISLDTGDREYSSSTKAATCQQSRLARDRGTAAPSLRDDQAHWPVLGPVSEVQPAHRVVRPQLARLPRARLDTALLS